MNKKIFNAFQIESRRHLSQVRQELAFLHEEKGECENHLEQIKQCALKLGGAAKIVSIDEIQVLSKQMADIAGCPSLFSEKNKTRVVDAVGDCVDTIEKIIAAVVKNKPYPLVEPILMVLETISGTPRETSDHPIGSDKTDQKIESVRPVEPPGPQDNYSLNKKSLHQKILGVFESEYKEHVENIRNFLDIPSDQIHSDSHHINEAYRAAHSMKGAARAVDLGVIQTLSHRMESIFSRVKENKTGLGKHIRILILKVLDGIEDYATAYLNGETPNTPTVLIEKLDTFLGRKSDPISVEIINQPESIPDVSRNYLKVEARNLDQMQVSLSELTSLNFHEDELSRDIKSLTRQIDVFSTENSRIIKQLRKAFPRFESDPHYDFMTQFINWVKHQTTILRKSGRSLYAKQKMLSKGHQLTINQIQADVNTARMVTAQNDFQVFRKMVRDLAADEGKHIDFSLSGLERKADRLVFQQLKDPVMHLLRNAVSHGVETAADRQQAGKSETAVIKLDIDVVKTKLTIRVSDDGRGMDSEQIIETALKKKLVQQADIIGLSSSQIFELALQPGFSTAPMITDLSGRGMGLSVVSKALQKLQGEIYIESIPGKGSLFSLSVPLTILTHRVLLIQFNEQVLSIPVASVDRLIRIPMADVKTIEGKSVIYAGQIPIPFTSLNNLMADPGDFTVADSLINVVIMQSKQQQLAIAVDHFLDERDVLVKVLPGPLRNSLFQGGFDLPDSSVCLILNPIKLLMEYQKTVQKTMVFNQEKKNEQRVSNRILIVDDSITTRTLEKTILEAHGYTVFVAVDGQEALNQLMSLEVDLVITDVDMPRMNGFDLIREMKARDHLKQVPVIIVTSMEKTTDKQQGLDLGANAYIVKQKFEQQDLLETIKQIL